MIKNSVFSNLSKANVLLICASFICYYFFAYHLLRSNYVTLIILFVLMFSMFYLLMKHTKHDLKILTWVSFLFRAIFIFAIPNLSQDFYRFIWDGRLILEGINPYLYTVDSFINKGMLPIAQAQELFSGMGLLNASHFTNYPPLNQLCFALAAIFSKQNIFGSVLVMRLIIIAADFGTLHFGKKLLHQINVPTHAIFWYLLNPLIIIELTGNLHFEGVMIFFLVWSLYLFHNRKYNLSSLIFSLSITIKLIPLIFLPLFFQKLGWKKSFGYYIIISGVILIAFSPFFSESLINNYSKSVGLWFKTFEFNASFYYIVRAFGYLFRGYNEIAIIGKILALVVFLFVIYTAFFKNNKTTVALITNMIIVLSCYYFSATTVHPWYVTTLVMLSVFTNYKFPIVWSFAIILSYLAYSNSSNQENLLVITLEYLIVFSVLIWDVFKNKKAMKINS